MDSTFAQSAPLLPKKIPTTAVGYGIIILASLALFAASIYATKSSETDAPLEIISNDLVIGLGLSIQPPAVLTDSMNATIAGVDANNNGVRDDLEQWIGTRYGDHSPVATALLMNAKMNQKLMLSNPTSQKQAAALVRESSMTTKCTDIGLKNGDALSSAVINEQLTRTFNTPERMRARIHVYQMAGSPSEADKAASMPCAFA